MAKNKLSITVNLKDIPLIPFEGGTAKTTTLLAYFLYKAPTIQSTHSDDVINEYHKEMFSLMFSKRGFSHAKFIASNVPIKPELEKAKLFGDEIHLNSKRFVCKKIIPKNGIIETDLECFLRHIRNAIAHGGVYYTSINGKTFYVFEDCNFKNLTSRIVCRQSDLQHWKNVLSKYQRET